MASEKGPKEIILEIPESEILSISEICRLCANRNDKLVGIFSEEGLSNDLANKMNLYLPIKVSETDTLPLQCCWSCASTLLQWHELVVISIEADRRLRSCQFIPATKEFDTDDAYNSPDDTGNEEHTISNEIECDRQDQNWLDSKGHDLKEGSACTLNDINNIRNNLQLKGHPNEICKKEKVETHEDVKSTHVPEVVCGRTTTVIRTFIKAENIAVVDSSKTNDTFQPQNEAKLPTKKSDGAQSKIYGCNLHKHVVEEHGKGIKKLRRKNSEIEATYFCHICNKGFTRKFDMERHQRNRHPDQADFYVNERDTELMNKCRVEDTEGNHAFKCDLCEQTFKLFYYLTVHRSIHTGARPYCCEFCGKKFRISSGLMQHINSSHKGIKKFECEVCKKRFVSKQSKNEHMNIHTDSRPYICDICGKGYKQKASLHVHKIFHTNNYRFTCSICDKQFRRAQELKVHSWIHSGRKPHACKVCEVSFRLKHDLTRHMKTVHVNVD